MDIETVLSAFDAERRSLVGADEVIEILPWVTRRSYLGGAINMVESFGLPSVGIDVEIQSQIEHFRGLGQSFEWKTYSHDSPPELVRHLESAGFEVGETEAFVARELSSVRSFSADFDIRPVQTRQDLDCFRRVAEAVFKKDYALTTQDLADNLDQGSAAHTAYIASTDGTPAAIGRLYLNSASQFSGLYGGGTLPEFRGRGLYQALVEARALIAARFGARYVFVDALPTSFPILLRLGFTKLTETTPCTFTV